MNNLKSYSMPLVLLVAGTLAGCQSASTKSPDVADNIRKTIEASGIKGVTVSADRDKGVVTLTGQVTSDSEKALVESIAKAGAGNQVVSDQLAIVPPGAESAAKRVNSDLDKAIDKNLDAALIQQDLHTGVKYEVNNGVVTLSGEVDSQSRRAMIQKVAAAVLNVQQVVNELQVKGQKATSSN